MKNIILSIIILLSFLSCQKENPIEETREGNFFSMNTSEGEKVFDKELSWNSYYEDNDQLSIVISNSLGFDMAIFVKNADLLNTNFPIEIDGTTNVRGEIQYLNRNIFISPVFGEFDSLNYVAITPTDINLKINNFTDNIIEGEFNGTLSTRTGKELDISDGLFRTEIIIE